MVAKAKQKLPELPLSTKIVNPKQLAHSWKDGGDQCHHQGLERCKGGDPVTSPFNPCLARLEDDGSQRMTAGCHKLNWAVTPVTAAVPDAFLLLEQINVFPGTWYAANVFSFSTWQ